MTLPVKAPDGLAKPPVRWWHCFFGHHWSQWESFRANKVLVPDDERASQRVI